jgi:hypothetical protein
MKGELNGSKVKLGNEATGTKIGDDEFWVDLDKFL